MSRSFLSFLSFKQIQFEEDSIAHQLVQLFLNILSMFLYFFVSHLFLSSLYRQSEYLSYFATQYLIIRDIHVYHSNLKIVQLVVDVTIQLYCDFS